MAQIMKIDEVKTKILQGEFLMLAGEEALLKQLPQGLWIGGTIPYFMGENGGFCSPDYILVKTLPDYIKNAVIKTYDLSEMVNIPQDYSLNGFSYILIPGLSEVHAEFAKNCSSYPGIFGSPLMGWITGVHLDQIGIQKPKVFDGRTSRVFTEKAIVMHVDLPANKVAQLDIVNIFSQGDGDIIEFPKTAFEADECLINGKKMKFTDYIKAHNVDPRFPLVADYSGAKVNVSFQDIDHEKGIVKFYAPVFPGVKYRLAHTITDYEKEFDQKFAKRTRTPLISCNCILNYVHAKLEGKKVGSIAPITFGEIAYMLLNQTVVFLDIRDIEP